MRLVVRESHPVHNLLVTGGSELCCGQHRRVARKAKPATRAGNAVTGERSGRLLAKLP